eukprot:TRINITY_DN18871_c0_g1_i2.p1 TRINITY_DN18871_c0_g1~~TRINITY_DN18871_c0_g1_i2.p1  ORF type:complete len:266 (-),score=37.13 TRINITY_DN18871_c0_g1_i2:172-969(-)
MLELKGGKVKGVLCDITGVLKESATTADGVAIQGSIEAIERLRKAGIQVKYVTNECQCTRKSLHQKLLRLGFSMSEESIMPPAFAAREVINKENLRPHFLVHDNVLPDFEGIDTDDPNCVVVGDAVEKFTYDNMNHAFRLLKEKKCKLISLGKGKYYREDGQLTLDVGPFTAALEFASDQNAMVCGKPDPLFFQAGLMSLGLTAEEVVMVGDDIVSDVGGAQKANIRGVLVRTGKFTAQDENHPVVKPDLIVDNLKQLVDVILQQ